MTDDTPSPSEIASVAAMIAQSDAPPLAPPIVSLALAKAHLRIDDDQHEDDALIEGMIATAIGDIDGPSGWLGRALTPQTIVQTFHASAISSIRLPYPPLIAILSVSHRVDGAWAPMDASMFAVEDNVLWGTTSRWPSYGEPIRVAYRAGYDGQPGRVLPAQVRTAVLLKVGDLYRNRDAIGGGERTARLSSMADDLLWPLRVYL